MRKLILLFLVCWLPAFGAISATMQWDVRTTGSDSNSGGFDPGVSVPGTDYSQQNSPQITYTDLVIGVTTTKYTSVLNIVSSALPGNTLVITGGTGCTTGTYEILSNATITATVDRSLGTAASVCTAVLGGGNATICSAYSGANCVSGAMSAAVSSNTFWVKSGTYTQTVSFNSNSSSATLYYLTFEGYGSTHGDFGTKPLLTTATNSVPIFAPLATATYINLNLSSTAGTSNPLIYVNQVSPAFVSVYRSKLDCTGTSSGGCNGVQVYNSSTYLSIVDTEIALTTGQPGIEDGGGTSQSDLIYLSGDYIHGGLAGLADYGSNYERWVVTNTVFSGNSVGVYSTSANAQVMIITGNSFYNQTNENVRSSSSSLFVAQNNIFYGGTYGIRNGFAPLQTFSNVNAFGNIGTANYSNFPAGITGDISLSANPYTNAGGGVFTLNSTAGGGAALKAAGFPGVTPAGTGYLDIGALQSQGASGSSTPFGYVQ
jgi:hypothetical protein